jgi:hypothetical protein
MGIADETFEREQPKIVVQDAVDAALSRRVVQSFSAHPISTNDGTIPAVAIKWKLRNGTTETVLIGQHAALVLRAMFSRLEENNWAGSNTTN